MPVAIKHLLPFLLCSSLAIGIYTGNKLTHVTKDTDVKKQKISMLLDHIDQKYLETINTDSIVDTMVEGILENLDPHSVYIPLEKQKQTQDHMQGGFTGIGLEFYMHKDSVTVLKPIENGPSALAGIQTGDRVLTLDLDTLYGKRYTSNAILEKLKENFKKQVLLGVFRKKTKQHLYYIVSKKNIALPSVCAAYMHTSTMAYIKINRFSKTTYTEFKKALDTLKKQGATQLLLDLRANPGGYLHVAVKIADEFLEEKKRIVYTKDKNGKTQSYYATSDGIFKEQAIFVLIDENSASASEVLAGALQDNDRGVILGNRSFGKGLVQQEMTLGDGSTIRLTTAKYYTPTGRCIQRPYNNGKKQYFQDAGNQQENAPEFTTAKGKIVYGGGGITPDHIFKAKSKTERNIASILGSSFTRFFIFEQLDYMAISPISMYDSDTFIKQYTLPKHIYLNFIQELQDIGIKIELKPYQKVIETHLKATIAKLYYNDQAYYKIINQQDPDILQSIEKSAF